MYMICKLHNITITVSNYISYVNGSPLFLFNKTNRRTNFPNLFLSRNSTCFGQLLCPSSRVFHCTRTFGTGICHAGLMTAFKHDQDGRAWTYSECTVENSWWWAQELRETCRVSWQKKIGKIVRLLVLLKRNL